MSRRHGRAKMAWGKYRGVEIRNLPNSYLSWLTGTPILVDPKWWFLKESLIAELKFRGLNVDFVENEAQHPQLSLKPPIPVPEKPRRKIQL